GKAAYSIQKRSNFGRMALVLQVSTDLSCLSIVSDGPAPKIVDCSYAPIAKHFDALFCHRRITTRRIDNRSNRPVGHTHRDHRAVVNRAGLPTAGHSLGADTHRQRTGQILNEVDKMTGLPYDATSAFGGVVSPMISRQLPGVHAIHDGHRRGAIDKPRLNLCGDGSKPAI